MKNVSESFKEKIKKPFRRFSIRLSIGGTNYDENHIETFKIQSSIGNSDMISLGAFVADNLQLSLINNENYNFPEGAPITIFVALEGEQELCLGKFYVQSDSVEKTKMVTKVDAFGIAGKLAETEYTTNLTFPTSILNMINELETKYNLEFVNKDVLPNIQYKSKPAGTVRAMISEIAQLCCSNVRERFEKLNVHQLEFVFASDTNEILTADNYFTFKRLSDTPIAFTKLYVEKNDVAIVDGEELKADDLAYGTDDGYCIKITNEHIENEAELKAMYNKNFPYAFIPFECEMQGMPHLEVGDLIIVDELVNQKIFTGYTQKYEVGFNAVSDVDSVIFNDTALPDELTMNETTYVPEVITDVTEQPLQLHIISHALEYNGGFKSTFRSECPDESMLSVGSNGVRMEDIIKRTEKYISMWKVENDRILGMVAKLNGDITEMATKYEQTAEEIRLVAERLGEDNAQLKAMLSVMADQITLRVAEIRNEVEVKVSEILQTIDNISLKVAEIDGVKEKVGQIEITSESIRQSVEMLENDVQTGISEINQTVDSITHTVTALENGQETFKTEINQTVDSITHTVTALENGQETFQTQIEQTVDSITQTITKMEQDTETAFSQIRQEIDSINLEIGAVDKVTGESIVSLINLEPDNIKIESKNIDISGLVTFKDLEGNTETKINGNAIETGTINVLQSTPNSSSNLTITDSGIEINSDESGDFIVINGQNTGLRIWSGIWATVIQGLLGNDPNSGGIAIGAHDNYGMIKCYPRNYGQANRAGRVEIAAPVIFNGKIYQSATGNVTENDGYITKAELMEELEKWEPEGGGDAGGTGGSGSETVGDLNIVIDKAVDNSENETYMEDEYFRYSYNSTQRTCYPNVKKETPLPADYKMPDFILFKGALYEVVTTGSSSLYKNQSVDTFTINVNAYQIGSFDQTFSVRKLAIKNKNSKLYTVAQGSFYKCAVLEEVELPKSIVRLGSYTAGGYGVFQECVNLRMVIFQEGTELEDIGSGLFKGCESIERIVLPPIRPYTGTSYYLGSNLFYGCVNLQYADVSGLPYIPNSAFYNCALLSEVKIDKPTAINNSAFYGCAALPEISSESVETVGNSAFQNCTSLARIYLPKANNIGTYAFAGTAIKSEQDVTISPEVTRINTGAFKDCVQLTSFIHNGIAQIYPDAFENCTELKIVSLNGTGSVTGAIFMGCKKIVSASLDSLPNLTYVINTQSNQALFYQMPALERVSLAILTTIQNGMFQDCTALKSVNIPKAVTIGSYAFQNCTSLPNFSHGFADLTRIYQYAFDGCVGLTEFVANAVTQIDARAFQNCTNLRLINFSSVTDIGDYAFSGTAVSGENDVVLGSAVKKLKYHAFFACTQLTVFRHNAIKQVYANAFKDCTNLQRVYLNGTTYVGGALFMGCAAIRVIELDALVQLTYTITDSSNPALFDGLTTLQRVSLAALTTMQSKMFRNCSELHTVNLPSITKVSSYAFQNCVNLRGFDFTNITQVDSYAFQNCVGVDQVRLRNATRIQQYAFDGINMVNFTVANTDKSVSFGSYCLASDYISVLDLRNMNGCSISANAFTNMTNLSAVYFPLGYLNINSNAFNSARNCTFYFASQAHYNEQTAYNKGAYYFKIFFLNKEEYNNTVAYY